MEATRKIGQCNNILVSNNLFKVIFNKTDEELCFKTEIVFLSQVSTVAHGLVNV